VFSPENSTAWKLLGKAHQQGGDREFLFNGTFSYSTNLSIDAAIENNARTRAAEAQQDSKQAKE
tara:strand:+ start:94 stop:285 length:192 start_codon:yes stop_codon:yes gene_type:complete